MENNRQEKMLRLLPIEKLRRCQFQVRLHFDETILQELAISIVNSGIVEPIVVRELVSGCYEIIAGERRWRAAQLAGLQEVPCVISPLSDSEVREIILIENIQRESLTPLEEARGIQQLIDNDYVTNVEVAKKIGKSPVHVSQRLSLLKLPGTVKSLLEQGELEAGHVVPLFNLLELEQIQLAQKAATNDWTVRDMERAVRLLKLDGPKTIRVIDPNCKQLEMALSEFLGTKIALKSKGQDGHLEIYYHNNDALQGIFDKIGFRYE